MDSVETFAQRTGAVDICVVGASAGGVEALQRFAARLPAAHPAAILVVLHLPPTSTGLPVPGILARAGALPAVAAADGDELAPGRIHVAVPGTHLLVKDGRVQLNRVRINGYRPAVDALSAPRPRATARASSGVVLSGTRRRRCGRARRPSRSRGPSRSSSTPTALRTGDAAGPAMDRCRVDPLPGPRGPEVDRALCPPAARRPRGNGPHARPPPRGRPRPRSTRRGFICPDAAGRWGGRRGCPALPLPRRPRLFARCF